ncbi:hypothetical protein E6W17_41270 [Streptomyces sp. A1547]|nr:hypothetical protein E6W17_41270 [Streptomyces sp. A1547]
MLHPHGDSVLLDHQDPSLSGVQNPGSRPVVAALEATGLQADWDCDPKRAITVTPLDWRRRLLG